MLESGEYLDEYTFRGTAGDEAVIEIRSEEFDTYLFLIGPGGEQFENDDYNGSQEYSVINRTLTETGTFDVIVTTFRPGETGEYTLTMDTGSADEATTINETGELQAEDIQLPSGEYLDLFDFTWQVGDRIELELISDAFDTYLILAGPNGFLVENDDEGDIGRSHIIADLTESGSYSVGVTSYSPAEVGVYDLTIEIGSATTDMAVPEERNREMLSFADTTYGRLDENDSLANALNYDRKYYDSFAVDVNGNQEIVVNLESTDFDPVVILQTPEGYLYENDDYEGSTERSFLTHTASESGRYRVFVTSYSDYATGSYELTVDASDTNSQGEGRNEIVDGDGVKEIHGIFVGISDYPQEFNDLPFTAEDAGIAYRALVSSGGMEAENGIVLTNNMATRNRLEQAINNVASRADTDDLFIFFFSGHGDRVDVSDTDLVANLMDPDGQDETIELYDDAVLDDELRELLNRVPGTSVVVLDSCFSGGFVKDLSHPNRIGFYSSQEDVLSAVADKFQAGGYMARFFSDGLNAFQADQDPRNGAISAHELRHYVQERYRNEVVQEKSPDPRNWVSVSGNLGYQQAVVDLGGLRSPHTILFDAEE